jgi:3-oxoadipate enol-lactonase/4-carboxymuconolactone decarboxylase
MFVRAAGLTVHVQVEGPPGAPAVLLLHSLGTSLHVWDAQAAALSRSFRVIRPDMRGHGLTEVTSGPYAIEGLAADALAVLDELGVGRVHVAGLSIGGLIAQAVASLAPERVISLMLCDTAMVIPPPEGWHTRAAAVRAKGMGAIVDAVMARWVTPGFMETPAAIGLRAMLLRTDPEGYAGAAEAIAAEDRTAATHALRVPALVVVGDKDEATPPAFARALCDAISGARLVVLENAAHIPTIERPDAVSEALLGFLSPAVDDFYEAGMDVRRQVLGEAHVARSVAAITDLDRDFQRFITRTAWGGVWTRPGLDRRTRALLTMAMMAALGHHEEFRLHIRASPNSGTTPADIAEMLIQVAAYAGIPAANSAVRIAKETLKEMEGTKG